MVKRIEKISGINDKLKKPQQEWVIHRKKSKKTEEDKKKNKQEGRIDIVI